MELVLGTLGKKWPFPKILGEGLWVCHMSLTALERRSLLFPIQERSQRGSLESILHDQTTNDEKQNIWP